MTFHIFGKIWGILYRKYSVMNFVKVNVESGGAYEHRTSTLPEYMSECHVYPLSMNPHYSTGQAGGGVPVLTTNPLQYW